MAFILGTLDVMGTSTATGAEPPQTMPSNADSSTGNAVCRNLSTPLGSTGQDAASPAPPARLTVESLVEVLDLLRRLDEQAKAGVRALTHPAQTDADPTSDRAGGAGNHRSLGDTTGDYPAFNQETDPET